MESRAWNAIGNIRGVLFDLDNTLYDRDQTFAQCAGGFVKEHFAIGSNRKAEPRSVGSAGSDTSGD